MIRTAQIAPGVFGVTGRAAAVVRAPVARSQKKSFETVNIGCVFVRKRTLCGKRVYFTIVAFVVTLGASTRAQASITYNLNDLFGGGASAVGTITTDGAVGVLAASDVLDWNIVLNDGLTTFDLEGPLSGNNSAFGESGSNFVGSSANLTFNFNGSGYALFQAPSLGSSIDYFCFAGQICGNFSDAITLGTNVFGVHEISETGVQVVATAGVPEPATSIILLGSGLAAAFVLRRARKGVNPIKSIRLNPIRS